MRKRVSGLAAATAAVLFGVTAANAAVFSYTVDLNGPSENPANASPGTGFGTVDYNDVAHTLALSVNFSGLTGTVTNSHFHAVTATSGLGGNAAAAAVANVGVATTTPTLVGFPSGVTSGSFSNTLDLTQASSWNSAFVTAQGSIGNAETAFAGALVTGRTYWNIHTSTFNGGEIRGFPVAVPEPVTASVLSLGLAAVASRRRRI